MKLVRNLEKNEKLYDGVERNFNTKYFDIKVSDNKIISFKSDDFSSYKGQPVENLKDVFDQEDFEKLITEGDFTFLNSSYIKSETHLSLETFIKDKYLFVFTFGEKQPSRWILILEGVWEILN